MEQTSKAETIDCNSPVTIIVKRRSRPDRVEEFEQVMSATTKEAMSFKGHLGANIIKPTKAGDYYRIVFKFDSMRNYLAWEGSEVREKWLERYAEVSLGDLEQEILSGLETWFTLPGEETLVPPPKYKMMCIVWFSIFPLSLLLNYSLKPVISELHIIGQLAIISMILVILMTYVVMPFMAKLFHRWLHCTKK
jgi:antibiotic biosynthesis monooxygenase (ABM) superfamily enzyme